MLANEAQLNESIMNKNYVTWLAIGILALIGFGMAVPGSPLFLPNLVNPKVQHGGHGMRHWLEESKSDDATTRQKAIIALGTMGAAAHEAVPAVAAALLKDTDPDVRNQAALALTKMVPASEVAVPALAQALTDEILKVRLNAAMALVRLGAKAKPAVPALLKALDDDKNDDNVGTFHTTIQDLVALALGRATAGTEEAVPALTAYLERSADMDRCISAARALAEVGVNARSAEPQLRKLLKHHHSDVRKAAAEALEEIGATPPENKAPVTKAGQAAKSS